MSELIQPDFSEVLDKYKSNLEWYRENYASLKEKHRGQIVIVIDKGVVETYNDINTLQERLAKKDKDIDPRTILIDYISENNTPLIV